MASLKTKAIKLRRLKVCMKCIGVIMSQRQNEFSYYFHFSGGSVPSVVIIFHYIFNRAGVTHVNLNVNRTVTNMVHLLIHRIYYLKWLLKQLKI